MSIGHTTASESSSPIIILIIGYLIGCSTNETTLADRINAFMPYWTIACLLAIAGMGYTELLAQHKKHAVVPSRKSSRSINRNSMSMSMRNSMRASTSASARTLGTNASYTEHHGASTSRTEAEPFTSSLTSSTMPIVENKTEVVHEPKKATATPNTTSEESPNAASSTKKTFVNLSGSYVLNRHENFETLLIAMGAPWAGRKLVLGQRPNQKITMDEEKIHLWGDGLIPIDQEYVFGADPIETKAKKGVNMDRVTILENGAVRLTRVNDVIGVTTMVDRELIDVDGGKVLRLSTRAEFHKKAKEPIEVKHFFDSTE